MGKGNVQRDGTNHMSNEKINNPSGKPSFRLIKFHFIFEI